MDRCLCNAVVIGGGGGPSFTTLFDETFDAPGGGVITIAPEFAVNINQAPSINSTYFVSGAYSWQSNQNACNTPSNAIYWTADAITRTRAKVSMRVRRQDMPALNRPATQSLFKLISNLGGGGPKTYLGATDANTFFVRDDGSGFFQLVGPVGAFTDNTFIEVAWDVTLNDPGVANGAIEFFIAGISVYTTTTANIINGGQAKKFCRFNNENDAVLQNCPGAPTSPPAMLLYDNVKLEVL